jgi:hypothetical protein
MGVVIAHLVSTLVLVGFIWTVQLVHYPAFADVDAASFPAFHQAHSARITLVVAPAWLVEGVTTAALLVAPPAGVPRWLVWAGALAAMVPVVVTIGVSVPSHTVLAGGFDAAVHARLVATNWWRTVGWSMHGAIAVAITVMALRRG